MKNTAKLFNQKEMHENLLEAAKYIDFTTRYSRQWREVERRLHRQANTEVTGVGAIRIVLEAFGCNRIAQVAGKLVPVMEFQMLLQAILPESAALDDALKLFEP